MGIPKFIRISLSTFIGISILVHLLLIVLSRLVPSEPKSNHAPVEFQVVSRQPQKPKGHSQQIVRQALLPEKLKIENSDDPIHFLSAQTQRVKEQTQALLSGKTKNRSAENREKANPTAQTNPRTPLPKHVDPRRPGGLQAYAPEYKSLPNIMRNQELEQGLSSIGEAMPNDVPVGSFTALNTDRYLFYSFYSRIEDLIRLRWESMVTETINSTPRGDFTRTAIGKWTTQLEIWLNAKGEFHSAHLMKESGIKGFDRAAIQSFVQAGLFPNPPQQMVEKDGLIRLKYAFQVRYEPKVVARP